MAKLGYEDSLTGNMIGKGEATTQLKDIVKALPLRVLSEADWHHWTTRGYVIVKDAVPPENLPPIGRTPLGVPGDGSERSVDLVQASAPRERDEGAQ